MGQLFHLHPPIIISMTMVKEKIKRPEDFINTVTVILPGIVDFKIESINPLHFERQGVDVDSPHTYEPQVRFP